MEPGAGAEQVRGGTVAFGRADLLEPLMQRHTTGLLTFLADDGDHHRAEELFQEVFLAVWGRARRTSARRRSPWLYAIAVNCRRADFASTRRNPVALASTDRPTLWPPDAALSAARPGTGRPAPSPVAAQQRAVVVLGAFGRPLLTPDRARSSAAPRHRPLAHAPRPDSTSGGARRRPRRARATA